MEAGTIPTNWEDLDKHSSERVTAKDVTMVDTWSNGPPNMGATDQLSDPFAVVIDHYKSCKMTNHGNPTKQNAEQPVASEGYRSPLLQSDHLNQAAANSFVNMHKQSINIRRAGF